MKKTIGNWLNRLPDGVRVLAVALVLVAVAMPAAAGAGALSWAVGLLFCRYAKTQPWNTLSVTAHVNLVVTGVLLASERHWSGLFVVQVGMAAVATMLLTVLLTRLFYYYWIPVLLWPSLVVAWVASSIADLGVPSVAAQTEPWAVWYGGGVVLATSLLVSPIFAGMLALGASASWTFQTFLGSQDPSIPQLLTQSVAYAICSSYLLMPARRSMGWSLLGLGLTVFLINASSAAASSGSLLHMLGCTNLGFTLSLYGAMIFNRQSSFWSYSFHPERKLDEAMTQWTRFRVGEARTGLPFKGSWNVSQSFDGPWTHKGIWRHGVDFVVKDEGGKTYQGNGFDLGDYYAYGKDVLAPTSGYIVAMASLFPDNPVGSVNNLHKFGNYVMIRDAYGAHVLVAHLMKDSVTHKLHQYVEAGQVIGRCGNSGYSPEPHIHLHVQADPLIGSPTIPFHLTNFLVDEHFHFHRVPLVDERVTRPSLDENIARRLSFEVNEIFTIENKASESGTATRIESCLDPVWGSMYFTDGEARLFHHRDAFSFYFYRYEGQRSGPLYDLMTAMPRVPLIYGINCRYGDSFPIARWKSTRQRWQSYARQIWTGQIEAGRNSFLMNSGTLEITGETQSEGGALKTSCLLDPIDGLVEFSVGERTYEVKTRRVHTVVHNAVPHLVRLGGVGQEAV